MSKALKVVSAVASIVALIPGPWQLPATAIAIVAGIGSSLTQKKPPAQGNTSQIQIGANMPMPYTMGRTYVGGVLVHDVGYGGTVDDVPNPYRSMVIVGSTGGPIESIEAFQADFTTIGGVLTGVGPGSPTDASGYYAGYLAVDYQLGATPESAALSGPHGAISQWGSGYKLSGYAAWLVTLDFDKKGKIFAAGVPQFGVIMEGVKAYDARLDSSYPGGSGSHDFADEATYEFTENPSLHATTYARGRYQGASDDRKVIGCGFTQDTIDWPAWVAFANVCDANDWKVGGTIHEGPGQSRWDNLKRICACGGAEPVFVGGMLSVRYPSPKTALDTITAADLADGEYVVPAMKSWKDRKNGIIPRYRSETHKWEYVQSDLVTVSSYVTEDGEEKNEERQYDLVQDKDQAAQLAAYELTDAREFGPIVLPCKPRLMEYKPGEALDVDIPELGLNEQLCVIIGRSVDPSTAIVTLTLESETTAKHAYALGQSGTAPATPTIMTGEDLDEIAQGALGLTNFENMPIMPDVGPITVQADYTGTILTGQLPKNVAFKRYNGATDVTTSAAWSLTVISGDIDATVGAATGIVEITDVVANGVIEVTSALNGVTASRRVPVSKAIAEPPASSGGGSDTSFDSSILATAQNTYSPINAGPLTLTCGAGGEIECAAPLAITPDAVSPNGTEHAYGKWEISPAGAGTWSDVDTEIQSDVAAVIVNEGGGIYSVQDGAITVNQTATSLTPGNDYDLRLRLRNNSGTRTLYYTGTASITTA